MELKTIETVKVGDVCYIWGRHNTQIKTTTIENIRGPYTDGMYGIKYSNGCEAFVRPKESATLMGMYSSIVYFNKEELVEAIQDHIKALNKILESLEK